MSFIKKAFKYAWNKIENKIFILPFKIMPLKDTIVFESIPDMSDNTKAVFDEMLSRGLNQKYKMIWLVRESSEKLPVIDNVYYISAVGSNFKERMKLLRVKTTARCLICCNYFLLSERKGQVSFYLTHGTPVKNVKGYYMMPSKIDYCLSASEHLVPLFCDQLGVQEKKMFALGYPRNDVLSTRSPDLHNLFDREYDKLIIWYPTYRQHKAGGKLAAKNVFPIIHDQDSAVELNDFARENNALIVIKPHFAQDITYIKELGLSNILFINDSFFVEKNISAYEFVAGSDALISDYSSIYFDYVLCDKPIALVWEDYEEYKQNVGFAVDMEYYMKGGQKIYDINEFKEFIYNVATDNDVLKQGREEIKRLVNYSDDGRNSERVTDFIIQKMGEI